MSESENSTRRELKRKHLYSNESDDSEGTSEKKPKTLQNKNTSSPTEEEENTESTNLASLVAAHYNSLEKDFEKRVESKIFYLRNFNNWIKAILIKESTYAVMDHNRINIKVLDIGCGKGGDLSKWVRLNVRYMICTDIAENSLEYFINRYNNYIQQCERNRKYYNLQCEFIVADSTKVRLRGKFKDPSIRFDLVSCQFSFHYCFESLPQAECMLKNATECLKPGGLFVGTIPNAYEIVKKLREGNTKLLKNDIFSLKMCCDEPYPLFGAKYHFRLEGVLNCPEFLVYFPLFVKLAEKFGLRLVKNESFTDFFEKHGRTRLGEALLRKMTALERYPPEGSKKLVGPVNDYNHAKTYCEVNNVRRVGTLSQSEWEVISLYQIFVFKKVEGT